MGRLLVVEEGGQHLLGDALGIGMTEPDAQPSADHDTLHVEDVDDRGDTGPERPYRSIEHLPGELVLVLERPGPDATSQSCAVVLLHQLEEVCLAPLLLLELAHMNFHG